ncbi:hypothetical protein ABMA27_006676 [Loxostege sticticalis]|uniref:RNA-directed DNA polymerase n=1 Tax=Loxostege sticticalis TaxID=481309 RepID=A0ABR3IJZ4_LOXSC
MPPKTRQHRDSDKHEPEDESSGEDCDDFGPAEADHATVGNDRTASGATPTTTTSRNDVIGITEDQLARLITNVIRGLPTPPTNAGRQTETPTAMPTDAMYSAAATPTPTPTQGNFTRCTARFDGTTRSAEVLEAFIESVLVYKECAAVSDEHALRGLPMLLTGDAAVWWQGVRTTVKDWDDAIRRLRFMYGAPRPAYRIFRQIFAEEQTDERSDSFISRVRANLSRLPYKLHEQVQVDIVYGLLNHKIRKRVPYESVKSIDWLLEQARFVEDTLVSNDDHLFSYNSRNKNASDKNDNAYVHVVNRPNARNANSNVNPSSVRNANVNIFSRTETDANTTPSSLNTVIRPSRNRPRCSLCKRFGHITDECRSRSTPGKGGTDFDKPKLFCYGCGQVGVVRSKCSTCVNKTAGKESPKLEFQNIYIDDVRISSRPIVKIEVAGRAGVALFDTGATHSKIIEDLEENDDPFRGRNWSTRGYLISDGILYRCLPETDDEDCACLVVPEHEREKILADLHDAPTAGHFGVERTLQRIRTRYFWPGMRDYVAEYIKQCTACQRYKADNRKPAGLLQTPASTRRFEVVSVDLFGPLPRTAKGNRWILIIEDVSSRWVELFALENATSAECTEILVAEIFLRYGVPRRLISDNGVQFVGEVMQQACHVMGIKQYLTPLYHPEANPVERKNRDLKPQLAILVGKDHTSWDTHLAAIRFAMNSAVTANTGFSPAFLTFGRELRAPSDAVADMKTIVDSDNFVANITPYLPRLSTALLDARDVHERAQSVQKACADEGRRAPPDYKVGDLVLLKAQGPNDAGPGQTAKFIPRRDGPYRIREIVSPSTYQLEGVGKSEPIGRYHASHLTPFIGDVVAPVREKRRRGRPRRYSPSDPSPNARTLCSN